MVGITSYGAYLPLWRLSREAIAKGSRGEKSICYWDEDSITMAVAAARDGLKGVDRLGIDGLIFASTTSPYKEKQAAGIVAAGADLSRNIITADFGGSLKAGTGALRFAADAVKAGSSKQVLVVATDRRQGAPLSAQDRSFGDGAAALLLGDKGVIASIEGSYSNSDEILDVWRADGEPWNRNTHERFAETEGFAKVIGEAIKGLLAQQKLAPKDFAKLVLNAPSARRGQEVARSLGFDPKTQLQDSLADVMGNTGVPYALMLLVSALETAKPGDLILLANHGDGADAFALRVTDRITKIQQNEAIRGMKKHLASKRVVTDYKTYWLWRGLLNPETQAGFLPHHFWKFSPISYWRERDRILRLHGAKCQVCGSVHFPPQNVCSKCHTREQFEPAPLADKKASVFSYSMDYVSSEVEVPIGVPIINFEGGGSAIFYMTDTAAEEMKVGMPVEMSFRKMSYREGVHNYYWKGVPVRA